MWIARGRDLRGRCGLKGVGSGELRAVGLREVGIFPLNQEKDLLFVSLIAKEYFVY